MAEGFSNSGLLALPYNAAGEQMGSTQDRVDAADGTDYVIGGITPADVADMAYIRVYGVYHGPEEALRDTWTLPVALEPAEERALTLDRQAGPYRLDALEISPLSIALTWRRTDGEVGHPGLQVTLRDGAQAALEAQGGRAHRGRLPGLLGLCPAGGAGGHRLDHHRRRDLPHKLKRAGAPHDEGPPRMSIIH